MIYNNSPWKKSWTANAPCRPWYRVECRQSNAVAKPELSKQQPVQSKFTADNYHTHHRNDTIHNSQWMNQYVAILTNHINTLVLWVDTVLVFVKICALSTNPKQKLKRVGGEEGGGSFGSVGESTTTKTETCTLWSKLMVSLLKHGPRHEYLALVGWVDAQQKSVYFIIIFTCTTK